MFLWPAFSKPVAAAAPSFNVFARISILPAIFTFPVDTATQQAALLARNPEAGARYHQCESIPSESINQMVVVKGDHRQAADRAIVRTSSGYSVRGSFSRVCVHEVR